MAVTVQIFSHDFVDEKGKVVPGRLEAEYTVPIVDERGSHGVVPLTKTSEGMARLAVGYGERDGGRVYTIATPFEKAVEEVGLGETIVIPDDRLSIYVTGEAAGTPGKRFDAE